MVRGSLRFFGTHSVSEEDHMLNLHIESSSFPNWNRTDQKRILTFTGDEMKETNPVASSGGTAYVVWKRRCLGLRSFTAGSCAKRTFCPFSPNASALPGW